MTEKRRVHIELSAPVAEVLDRLQEVTNLGTKDIFVHALTLFRLYVKARGEGKEFRIFDPSTPHEQIRLEMPVHVPRATNETVRHSTK